MDTIRKQLVDDKRANDIFARVRLRLSNERIKTNEKYLEILIDEINKYFSDLSTSTINSNDLPDERTGPLVNNHNKLLVDIASDLDKVNKKRIEVQSVITKAVNYLSAERVSVNNAVSKMHARIINQKLRTSANDRHITFFSEYFTNDKFVDKKLSKNVSVDSALSALTLSSLVENKDNSNMIDTNEIFVEVKLKNNESVNRFAIYPASQPINQIHMAGFGRTVTNNDVITPMKNLNSAGTNSEKYNNIQKQCVVTGEITDPFTFGEFELIFNDFKNQNLRNTIIKSIKRSVPNAANLDVDPQHVVTNSTGPLGSSFNGAYYLPNETIATDNVVLKELIQSVGLKFKLKQGQLRGLLSYIRINFVPSETNLSIPQINYNESYIKDSNGIIYKPFKEMKSVINGDVEDRLLMLDSVVVSPIEFYIAFQLPNLIAIPIKSYTGLCWKVRLHGSDVTGYASDNQVFTSSSNKYIFVYHDVIRDASDTNFQDINKSRLKEIMSHYDITTLT